MKCTMMKRILALLSWGLICIPKDPEAFTFAKMEVGHPVLTTFLDPVPRNTFRMYHSECTKMNTLHPLSNYYYSPFQSFGTHLKTSSIYLTVPQCLVLDIVSKWQASSTESWVPRDSVHQEIGAIIANTFKDLEIQENTDPAFLRAQPKDAMDQPLPKAH